MEGPEGEAFVLISTHSNYFCSCLCFSDLLVYRRLVEAQDALPLPKASFANKKSIFHPKNLWRTKVLDDAMEAAISEQRFEEALDYGLKNIEGMK